LLLAPTLKQANLAFRAIRKDLHQSRALKKRIVGETQDSIKLDNGITIACYIASYVAVRGLTIIAAICDEMAFWRHDASADWGYYPSGGLGLVLIVVIILIILGKV